MNTTEKLSFENIFSSIDNRTTNMKIGGTVYELTTHFNSDGTQSVLQQFTELITEYNFISKSA